MTLIGHFLYSLFINAFANDSTCNKSGNDKIFIVLIISSFALVFTYFVYSTPFFHFVITACYIIYYSTNNITRSYSFDKIRHTYGIFYHSSPLLMMEMIK